MTDNQTKQIGRELPEGWQEVRLGDVMEIKSGKVRPKNKGNYPVYGGNGILDYGDDFNCENETIIVGRVGAYCGSVFYESNKFWLSDNALGIKNKENSIAKYLFYYLENKNLNKISIGAAQPLLTQGILNQIEIPLPPLPEQQAIAAILSSLDDKIELLRDQNKTLEELGQKLFQRELAESGDDWEERRLGEVLKFRSGFAFKGDSFVETGIYKALKIKDILGYGKASVSNLSSVLINETYDRISDFILKAGDILIAMSGNTTGKIGIMPFCDDTVYLNQRAGKLFFNNFIYKEYIYYFLMSENYELKILNMAYGSAQPNINPLQIENIETKIPSEVEMLDFHNTVSPIFSKILANAHQIQTLSKIRDTLLPQLMSGVVRAGD